MPYDRALCINPRHVDSWINRGATLGHLGRFDEALECYARAISLAPGFADAHYHEAIFLLSMMQFEKGWRKFEWRWKRNESNPPRIKTGKPMWSGDPGVRLLLWCDQGIGDEILWSSLWNNVRQQAAEILVETDPRLIPLFERSFTGIRFWPKGNPVDERMFDAHCRIDSLGQYFLNDVPSFKRRPYGRGASAVA